MTSTKHARIRHLAIGRPRHSPNISPPQPTPALRHLKAPHGCRLLHLRQPAYQPKGLRFRLDERSVAGHSHTGRPSVDPELLIRMLLVGYCFGIRSERRLCEEVHLNLAYRWFCRLDLTDRIPDHSTFSKNRHGRFRERVWLAARASLSMPA